MTKRKVKRTATPRMTKCAREASVAECDQDADGQRLVWDARAMFALRFVASRGWPPNPRWLSASQSSEIRNHAQYLDPFGCPDGERAFMLEVRRVAA